MSDFDLYKVMREFQIEAIKCRDDLEQAQLLGWKDLEKVCSDHLANIDEMVAMVRKKQAKLMADKNKIEEQKMTTIKLGRTVQDKVTKFTGIAVSRTEHLQGCAHVGVKSQELHEGKPIVTQWFDEPQLVVLDKTPIMERTPNTGGPSLDGNPVGFKGPGHSG